MEHRKDILWRTYLIYIVMVIFALSILYRIFSVQVIQGEYWRKKADQLTTVLMDIDAARGNIYDVNGNMLATSLPYYEVGMDVNAPSITKDTFNKYIDSLAYDLHDLFPVKSKKEFKQLLRKARETKDRYIIVQRNVSYRDLQKMKSFPLLRKGKKGGLVTLQTNKRERPFRLLAARTIGYSRNEVKVGIEGAYDSILKGISGKRLMQKVAADVWRPINYENEIEPQDGNDVYTSIDINIQDVAENALQKQLVLNNASHGCVVLMEVKTGEIRAIANLTRTDSSKYSEVLNYALGYPAEPGSTFKLASMLVALDDGYIELNDKVFVGNGECFYYDVPVKDSHHPEAPEISVQRVFETSSNVGVTKIITKYYSKDPQRFVDKLKSFNLGKPLGLGIPGEGIPTLKNAKEFSGLTLPWMSYGYETLITPLQILTLYNAVANNGVMVKPQFVKEIKKNGVMVKKFKPEIIESFKVKPSTIAKAKQMLEGVVKNGTGKGVIATSFNVAGKTGTAQIARNGSYKLGGNTIYQASFVGYFPAEEPIYTCIVIVNSPSNGIYYGGSVAGPIFKEIAEKVYSNSLDCHKQINDGSKKINRSPDVMKGKSSDINYLLTDLNIPHTNSTGKWVTDTQVDSTKVVLGESAVENSLKKGVIPVLNGLSGKDALYLLENNGLQVRLQGFGTVKRQSIDAGSKFAKGTHITLILG